MLYGGPASARSSRHQRTGLGNRLAGKGIPALPTVQERRSAASHLSGALGRVAKGFGIPKVRFWYGEIEAFLADILDHALIVVPNRKITIVTEDPDDNRVLECAVAAGARTIISGDKHLLDLAEYEGVRVVDAGTALAELADHQ